MQRDCARSRELLPHEHKSATNGSQIGGHTLPFIPYRIPPCVHLPALDQPDHEFCDAKSVGAPKLRNKLCSRRISVIGCSRQAEIERCARGMLMTGHYAGF